MTSSSTASPQQTSNMNSHKRQHHHHNLPRNHNFWAHFRQRLRRNCLAARGPLAVLFLAILIVPCLLNANGNEKVQVSPQEWVAPYLPFVEAVPFFRRITKSRKIATTVSGVAQATPTEAPTATATATATEGSKKTKSNRKRKFGASSTNYYFPLMDNAEDFENHPEDAKIPFRYMEAHQKEGPARKAVLNTLQWRREWNVDTILSRPHPNYDIAKRILPHYFIGFSEKQKNNNQQQYVVFIQRPGLSDLKLAKHNGISLDDMLYQYAWVFEYCWNILHDRDDPNALMISIIDLQGINFSLLRKPELLNFVKTFVAMIDAHYPTRAQKTYMINAPTWFSTLYKVIKPVMRETTREKIVLYSAGKEQHQALEQALGKDMANLVQEALQVPQGEEKKKKNKKDKDPSDLALTSDILLDTPMEQEMRNFVLDQLDGQKMKPIVAPKSSSSTSS